MSDPILYLPPEHSLHGLPEPLRSQFAAAQRNLIHLEFPTAGAICARVFDDLRISVDSPEDLADKPVSELVDLPYRPAKATPHLCLARHQPIRNLPPIFIVA